MLNIYPPKLNQGEDKNSKTTIHLVEKCNYEGCGHFSDWEKQQLKTDCDNKKYITTFFSENGLNIVVQIDKLDGENDSNTKEILRKSGNKIYKTLSTHKVESVNIHSGNSVSNLCVNLVEGISLSAYSFQTYMSEKKEPTLKTINISDNSISQSELNELRIVIEGVFHTRTLVNEPTITLTSVRIAEEIMKLGSEAKFKVTVLDKKQIQDEKMGGLLAVNLGSQIHPTFSIMEYSHPDAKNKKPYVLVGKGVVYDTGGLSLKPTAGSMDSMKSDMGGAGTVIGTMYSIAKNQLPINIVGLVPATDNRPGENAYVPGDVITMHNGKTVEVLNTDAEGRLLLGDALSYAKNYDPELVIDLATLTGAQLVAIGSLGAAVMGTADDNEFNNLSNSGYNTYERVARLPFWKEYNDMLKSPIADLKNIGGREAGCITAGKFLENFVDYPWIHIDIAGPSFSNKEDSYRPKGGTGYGVRLLYDFFKSKC